MAYNVLLVDDSIIIRAVISKVLRLAGDRVGEVYEAQNGEEALALLEHERVDIVFTDISMPVMSGEQMVERLHASGATSRIPVVVVSSASCEARIARMRERGVRDFIQKPFTPERIRRAVDEVLEETADAG
jgi:two-component system chemotaxis response regulator CheY